MRTQTTDRVGGLAIRRTGTGEPVLVLHDCGGGLDSWAGVADHLADSFEVWRCARRGYAPSPAARRPRTFEDEVVDVRTLLDTVRAVTDSDVHLVGAGYGATLALHTALAEPAGLRSLVLYEPPLLLAGPHLDTVLTRYRALVAAEESATAAHLLATEVAPEPTWARREATGWGHDLEALAADTTDVARWSSIALPVLLAQGGDSVAPLPAGMDALAAALPHAERVVWAGQSHVATSADPGLVARTLRPFLATR